MNYSRKFFYNDILKCLEICDKVKRDRKNGIAGECNLEQLNNIILPELKELLIIVDKGNLPPQNDRYLLSFANAFKVWGWDINNPTELFICLIELNNNYKNI